MLLVQSPNKGTGGLRDEKKTGEHLPYRDRPEYRENTRDLRKLAVTQTPVKDHQLSLMWKRVIIKKEKKDKYLDLARELKKLWNMQVTIIPIVIGAFGTVTKGLLKGLVD